MTRTRNKPFIFGGYEFPTKQSAADAIRQILYGYGIGESLDDTDEAFMCDVLALHPEADQKTGVGVRSLEVESNGPTRGFWITRLDGSRTDFSFLSCLRAKTHRRSVLDAMRTAIRGQIEEFREREFGSKTVIVCPVNGSLLTRGTCHVDHAGMTFLDLVEAFLFNADTGIDDVAVKPMADGSTQEQLADPAIEKAWQEFHRREAQLRVVSPMANLSILRKGWH